MSSEVTVLLQQLAAGKRHASEELLPLIYEELRRLARARMSQERPGQTLQATALVHEAYLRLIGTDELGWDSRGHFFAAAAEARRRILIERARRRARLRHGGEMARITLDEVLTRLEAQDEQMANLVKLRYFGGLTVEECAAAMGQSPRTVNRLWTAARAWLRREMGRGA